MNDPHLRLIHALAECAQGPLRLIDALCADWASTTFAGHRHVIRFETSPAVGDRLCAGLAAHDFAIPGHLVADIAVAERTGALIVIEALTIEDR